MKQDLFITFYWSFFIIFEFKLAKMVQEKENKIIEILTKFDTGLFANRYYKYIDKVK